MVGMEPLKETPPGGLFLSVALYDEFIRGKPKDCVILYLIFCMAYAILIFVVFSYFLYYDICK